ncbi:MAG TPA: hypothetical protein VKZ53_31870 [Candidatus Angelobacter sp.]|nr:hypothetical protein [Candidatus Angelobacter sp.]
MIEQELQQQRSILWRTDGNAVRTLDDARTFLAGVGFCLMYPDRAISVMPTFLGACAGTSENLPDAKHAFADARTGPANELVVRLMRERQLYQLNLTGDITLLASARLFPFFYTLLGDRNPKATPATNGQGVRISPLAIKAYEIIAGHGSLSIPRLQELIGRELTTAALERALHELWAILKIGPVDFHEKDGATWDLLYHWSPEAVKEGVRASLPEAISALLGQYLETVIAVDQDEMEQFFSKLSPLSKIREAIHALLATRELSYLPMGSKTLIQLTPAVNQELPRNTRKT